MKLNEKLFNVAVLLAGILLATGPLAATLMDPPPVEERRMQYWMVAALAVVGVFLGTSALWSLRRGVLHVGLAVLQSVAFLGTCVLLPLAVWGLACLVLQVRCSADAPLAKAQIRKYLAISLLAAFSFACLGMLCEPGVEPHAIAGAITTAALAIVLVVSAWWPRYIGDVPILASAVIAVLQAGLLLCLPWIFHSLEEAAMDPLVTCEMFLLETWALTLVAGFTMLCRKDWRGQGWRILRWSLVPVVTSLVVVLGMVMLGLLHVHRQ